MTAIDLSFRFFKRLQSSRKKAFSNHDDLLATFELLPTIASFHWGKDNFCNRGRSFNCFCCCCCLFPSIHPVLKKKVSSPSGRLAQLTQYDSSFYCCVQVRVRICGKMPEVVQPGRLVLPGSSLLSLRTSNWEKVITFFFFPSSFFLFFLLNQKLKKLAPFSR